MFVFLRRRLLRFLAVAILLPVLGALVVKASDKLEGRRGQTIGTKALRKAGLYLKREPS